MFNSLLNRKEKMGFILFWWLIIVLSIGLGIQFYKWLTPENFVNIETKIEYKTIEQVELESLTQGQSVKYNGKNLCVSSIYQSRAENDYTSAVEINLRKWGNCNRTTIED